MDLFEALQRRHSYRGPFAETRSQPQKRTFKERAAFNRFAASAQ
jgi:hypothetical protein